MLAIERKGQILEYLLRNRTATVNSLAEMMQVTEETIRRDLRSLESDGSLVRTHGGAFIPEEVSSKLFYDSRDKMNQQSKERIAKECVKLINQGDCIFLDSSTTVSHLAMEISNMELTVITNSLAVCNYLTPHSNIHLVALGGNYLSSLCAFSSPITTHMMDNYCVDKAFFTCHSIDINSGLTDIHENSCNLRLSAIRHSKFACCLAGSSKFERLSYLKLCDFDGIDALVTDYNLDSNWRKRLDDSGVWYLGKSESPFAADD